MSDHIEWVIKEQDCCPRNSGNNLRLWRGAVKSTTGWSTLAWLTIRVLGQPCKEGDLHYALCGIGNKLKVRQSGTHRQSWVASSTNFSTLLFGAAQKNYVFLQNHFSNSVRGRPTEGVGRPLYGWPSEWLLNPPLKLVFSLWLEAGRNNSTKILTLPFAKIENQTTKTDFGFAPLQGREIAAFPRRKLAFSEARSRPERTQNLDPGWDRISAKKIVQSPTETGVFPVAWGRSQKFNKNPYSTLCKNRKSDHEKSKDSKDGQKSLESLNPEKTRRWCDPPLKLVLSLLSQHGTDRPCWDTSSIPVCMSTNCPGWSTNCPGWSTKAPGIQS